MQSRRYRLGKALAFAVLIWITGFVWGSIVFMTPALKSVPSIPYISRYPWISFPLLILWPFLTFVLSRIYLRQAQDKEREGLLTGVVFWGVNIALDFVVLVLLLKAGANYFASLTIWVTYVGLLIVPWLTGRAMQTASAGASPASR
jgi:hypothetical protein